MRYILIGILALGACTQPKTVEEKALEFSTKTYEKEVCVEEDCSKVSVSYPWASGSPASKNINSEIEKQILRYFTADSVGGDLEQNATRYLNSYQEFKAEFPDAPGAWTEEIEAQVSYESENTLSIQIDEFNFSGGAHPNSSQYFLNFDKTTGELLSRDQVIFDRDKMLMLAQMEFRKFHQVEDSITLEEDGRFFIPETGFFLPNAIGYRKGKFILSYIPYEIGPYVLGYTELEFAMKEVKGFVRE
ncbi:DUF4163 domain-containing protein [Algoriphagus halophytocola]|uniref:DUF4163 domain-containing protein n=1 Tax=Algoriphagus halophytocola TaxID=2991499 RepID=A0ABY6MPM4_9BACT|nr:DUF4163 domain-containing protein [Algoriphagus sp. TR-M5]UZD24386.1 DUF4163 domain-containing protein [Algoriphagus sp. TR-M5]